MIRTLLLITAAGVTAAAAQDPPPPDSGTQDPRLQLVRLQLEGRTEETLAAVDRLVEEDPVGAAELGLHHLRGALLEDAGRLREAHEAFAQSIGSSPALAAYSRYRLALVQLSQGHPEVAAGLLAGLLSGRPPERLVRPAASLMIHSLAGGGDCRLLGQVDTWQLPERDLRRLQLARSDCDLSHGNVEGAVARLLGLLQQNGNDETARGAAERLTRLEQKALPEREMALLVGRVFHRHRQFDLSITYLEQGLSVGMGSGAPSSGTTTGAHTGTPAGQAGGHPSIGDGETLYALARSHFWQESYLQAASRFGQLAATVRRPEEKARALYQQGRSYELSGNWSAASQSYRLGYLADSDGRWADANLISALRVEWRTGKEESALQLYEVLGSRREWRKLFGRAALFLASSDLVRERTDRSGRWLADAARSLDLSTGEIEYWQGRLDELEGRPEEAIDAYLGALSARWSHPFGRAAAARLAKPELAPRARELARRLASTSQANSLYHAWLLLGDDDPFGAEAKRRLIASLSATRRAAPFLQIAFQPVEEWPLWTATLGQPEEMLLALGRWRAGSPAIRKHFPLADASLGFTAAELLARAGAHRDSLRIAEILQNTATDLVPDGLLPAGLRRLIFPRPYREIISREAANYRIDPTLLTALIREESRFDPLAVSAASARGLTQLVLPTANRMAAATGRERVAAAELHRPEVAINLGAAYLSELSRRFDGSTPEVIAAYNAGERQAELWRSYCYSREPVEFLSKVGFPETRAYLGRVLSTREQYRELYGEFHGEAPAVSGELVSETVN